MCTYVHMYSIYCIYCICLFVFMHFIWGISVRCFAGVIKGGGGRVARYGVVRHTVRLYVCIFNCAMPARISAKLSSSFRINLQYKAVRLLPFSTSRYSVLPLSSPCGVGYIISFFQHTNENVDYCM